MGGEGLDDAGDGGFVGDEVGLAAAFLEGGGGGLADDDDGFLLEGGEAPVGEVGFDAGGAGEEDDIGFGEGGVVDGVVVVEEGVFYVGGDVA